MKTKHMMIIYRIELDREQYMEYRVEADEKAISEAVAGDCLSSELWFLNPKEDIKWMNYEEFDLLVKEKNASVFETNLYKALKKHRGNPLPVNDNDTENIKDLRWLYYEKEFYAVVPVLAYWGHASLQMIISGTASNGSAFVYEYVSDHKHSLSIDGNAVLFLDPPKAGESLKEWLEKTDEVICRK